MVSEELILKFANAIAKAEGFYASKVGKTPEQYTVPQRANNPGDLTDEGDVGFGTIQTGGPHGAKITKYPTERMGWEQLHKKLRRMLNGASHTYTLDLTVMEVALKYSGDPAWARIVAEAIGVDTRATLAEIVQDDLKNQGLPDDGKQDA